MYIAPPLLPFSHAQLSDSSNHRSLQGVSPSPSPSQVLHQVYRTTFLQSSTGVLAPPTPSKSCNSSHRLLPFTLAQVVGFSHSILHRCNMAPPLQSCTSPVPTPPHSQSCTGVPAQTHPSSLARSRGTIISLARCIGSLPFSLAQV
ncbi:unnamed protein product [Staurois parvus]|uniref:Uncharacterized protein n=1 Tax=Staurois parvus TaxID=386267 RepID=A0ABN9EM70_9NEOB|nr:unnamed protein product [Staurois parvus]